MELAHGHAGFLGHRFVHTVQAVAREHHLMHPVQRLSGTAKPIAIEYEIAGSFVTASVAVVAGDTTRQRVRYDSGLTLWVNWRAEPWTTEGRVLPQWGFLARGPGTDLATFACDGLTGDYAECPEYVFADARTWFDLPYRQPSNPAKRGLVKPDAADFKACTNPPGTLGWSSAPSISPPRVAGSSSRSGYPTQGGMW